MEITEIGVEDVGEFAASHGGELGDGLRAARGQVVGEEVGGLVRE